MTSSPAASRICTGAITNVPPVFRSTSSTRPSTLKYGLSFVPRFQRHVRRPCRRSTVRNSSALVPSRSSVRWPKAVFRVTPFSVRVQPTPRSSPIGSRATLPKSDCATIARSTIRKRSPVGRVRASGVVRVGSPSAAARNPGCELVSWRKAPLVSRARATNTAIRVAATTPASVRTGTAPARAGRFEGRRSSLFAMSRISAFPHARREESPRITGIDRRRRELEEKEQLQAVKSSEDHPPGVHVRDRPEPAATRLAMPRATIRGVAARHTLGRRAAGGGGAGEPPRLARCSRRDVQSLTLDRRLSTWNE